MVLQGYVMGPGELGAASTRQLGGLRHLESLSDSARVSLAPAGAPRCSPACAGSLQVTPFLSELQAPPEVSNQKRDVYLGEQHLG